MNSTKLNLDKSKFDQCSGDILNLSGTTKTYGTLCIMPQGNFTSSCGYKISGTTILRASPNDINSIYIGSQAGNTGTGTNNIGVNYQALHNITTGCNNIAIGYQTLFCNTTGINNIAIGTCAGYNTNSNNKLYIANNVNCNLIYGDFTGNTVTLPTLLLCNTPITGALTDGLLSWNNTDKCVKQITVASITGLTNTTANNGLTRSGLNIHLGGSLTGNTNISGNYTLNINGGAKLNTICGYQISGNTILRTSNNDINSVYIGNSAGSNGTGLHNIGVGYQTLQTNTSGADNIALGHQSLYNNTTGCNNIANGNSSLYNNTGDDNIANGYQSLFNNLSGSENIGLGHQSLYCNTSGWNNIAYGTDSLYANTIGCSNIGIGTSTLTYNNSGCYNIAQGDGALFCNTTGCNNVAIGRCAGYNTNSSNKLYIANSSSCNLIYGDFINNTVTLPTLLLCNTPNAGSNTDSLLVWNSSDKCVKQISIGSITGLTNITANNGIVKSGNNIHLGGSLTGDTTINGNHNLTLKGAMCATCFVKSGGTSSQFLKGDGTVDNSTYLCSTGTAVNSTCWNGNQINNGCASNLNFPLVYSNTDGKWGCGTTDQFKSWLSLGCNAYKSIGYLPLSGGTLSGSLITPTLLLCNTPTTGLNTDSLLVWNSGDKCVKKISASSITGTSINSANNGLTKSGQNIRLGGSLTGNTIINGGYSLTLGGSFIAPTLLLCTTPATGLNSDSLLVWSSTDCCVKKITESCLCVCNTQVCNLATVACTGCYNDLCCKPNLSLYAGTGSTINGIAWVPSTGYLSITRQDNTCYSVSLDGRYLKTCDVNSSCGYFGTAAFRNIGTGTSQVWAQDCHPNTFSGYGLTDPSGVYLPLSAGSGNPLTGGVYFSNSVINYVGNNKFFAAGCGVNYLYTGNGSGLIIRNQADNATNFILSDAGAATFSSTINGLTLGVDDTYGSPYYTYSFNVGKANGVNKIFAPTDNSNGLFLASATGKGMFFRVNGEATESLTINSDHSANFTSTVCATQFFANNAGNSFNAQPTDNTMDARFRLNNAGGSSYVGIDNSTGSVFNGGNYSMNIYTDHAIPIVFSTNAAKRLTIDGSTGQLQSFVSTGTAPLTVCSNTLVSNLNAERWNGYQNTFAYGQYDVNNIGNGIVAMSSANNSFYTYSANAVRSFLGLNSISTQSTGGLSTNYLPKWNGSSLANSLISDNETTVAIIKDNNPTFDIGQTTYINTPGSDTQIAAIRFSNQRDYGDKFASIRGVVRAGQYMPSIYFATNSSYTASPTTRLIITEDGQIQITSTTTSTGSTTGALTVCGGIGVGGGSFFGGTIHSPDAIFGGSGTQVIINDGGYINTGSPAANDNLVINGKGTGSLMLNYNHGSGGTHFFNGNTTEVAKIDGGGNANFGSVEITNHQLTIDGVYLNSYNWNLNTVDHDGLFFKSLSTTSNVMFTDSGLFGFGTACPLSPMHILRSSSGDVLRLDVTADASCSNGPALRFQLTQANGQSASFGAISTAATGAWGADMIFYSKACNSSPDNNLFESMRILSSGNVVIGYQSEQNYKLAINGSGYFNSTVNTASSYQICGNNALRTSANDVNSIFIGNSAGSNGCGTNNFGVGCYALLCNSTGCNNIAIGQQALAYNTSGNDNIANGFQTLLCNTSGINNIANGYHALYYNTTGSNNIANGSQSLYSNTTGSDNIANGFGSLSCNTVGISNIANGNSALYHNICGGSNIATGDHALYCNTSGNHNIAYGYNSLYSNNCGSCNVAIGAGALSCNVSGCNNVAIGPYAGITANVSNKLYISNNECNSLIYGDFVANEVTVPTLLLCSSPTSGSITTDALLVWNSTDCYVKQLPTTAFLPSDGGTLTGDLCICGNVHASGCGVFDGGGFNSLRSIKNVLSDSCGWSGCATDIINNTTIHEWYYKNDENKNINLGPVIDDNTNLSEYLLRDNNTVINSYSMMSLAFKAIQELAPKIDKINDLEKELSKIKDLENEIKNLKNKIKKLEEK